MHNMRRGFTMIELILIIVIIGILAAVAIPKLSATRYDAKLSQAIADAKICINDAGAAYIAGTPDLTAWTPSPACIASAANALVTSTLAATSVTVTDTTGSAPASVVRTHTFGGTGSIW